MVSDFAQKFQTLTGNPPFPWQTKLFERFCSGDFPQSVSLPTGLGKTSILPIWLLALSEQPGLVPRRLVYVVNRRTVVDQATREAENLRQRIGTIPDLKAKFTSLLTDPTQEPLAISTLRGQFADNSEWRNDPSRPAIVVGTVDMIGSRLLFHGYGLGFRSKPLHAGFLGQDSLLVHDEAHLEPAFQELLVSLETEQKRCNEWKPLRVLELTATPRGSESFFELTDQDKQHPIVAKRIQAPKKLVFHPVADDNKSLSAKILELAKKYQKSNQSILIFARTIETITQVVAGLQKDKCQVQQLTGTMRGLERDQITDPTHPKGCPLFARFLPKPSDHSRDSWKVTPAKGTVFLVCTSAGEVGVNISADHLICDLSPLDSMAQRFGRVNRFGEIKDTQIEIIHPVFPESNDKLDDLSIRRKKTLELLEKLKGNGSPEALSGLPNQERKSAISPTPEILPVSDIHFDSWSMTTLRDDLPGRPPLAPYLHGISEYQPPETHIAWREEVKVITGDLLEEFPPRDLLEDYPIKPHELLKDRNDRILATLKKIKTDPNTPVWLLTDEGHVTPMSFKKLKTQDKEDISYKTILLPPGVGGLTNGLFSAEGDAPKDVADEWVDDSGPIRKRQWEHFPRPKGMKLDRLITFPGGSDEPDEESSPRQWFWYARIPESVGAKSQKEYPLDRHLEDAGDIAGKLAKVLNLDPFHSQVLILAARNHDLGKRRALWQINIGNRDFPNQAWAKSNREAAALERNPYRHEFGSLGDLKENRDFLQLSKEGQDLVIHLVATHHGRGRPHFPIHEVYDPIRSNEDSKEVANLVPNRFAKLQGKYGRWGLAYLESLLRAADILASQKAEEVDQ